MSYTGTEEQKTKRAKTVKLSQIEFDNNLIQVMGLPAGQYVLWHILNNSRLFSGGLYSKDLNDTIYRVAQRDLGIKLLNEMMQADINLTFDILKKRLKDDRRV